MAKTNIRKYFKEKLLFHKFDLLYLFIFCALPFSAVTLYLVDTFLSIIISLFIIFFVNLFILWLFQLHKTTKIIALIFKSGETIFSLLIIKVKGLFDIFYIFGNLDTVPDIIFSYKLLEIFLYLGLIIFISFFYYFISLKIKFRLTYKTAILMVLAFVLLQTTNGSYVFFDQFAFTGPKIPNYSAISYPTISKSKKITFDKEDNIILLHLESWNSKVVNGDVLIDGKLYTKPMAPVYLEYSKRGLYFPEFYGNSIQTIRSQENTLCGIANNISLGSYSYRGGEYHFKCLPEIFSENGFKTYFFKGGDLSFHRTDYFMEKIGFDVILNKKIMEKEDERYLQGKYIGYRDDIFYQRVFEFLEKEPPQKKFVYVAVSSLLHYPWDNSKELSFVNEYKSPKNFYEKFSNCLKQEDYALKKFFEYYNKTFPENTHLFIFGDTSWPVEINENNIYSHIHAFDDNFLTTLLYIPPQRDNLSPRVIKSRYDQIGLFHTILELFSKDYESDKSIPEITPNDFNKSPRFIRLNQPFSDKSVAMVKYPDKWIYNLINNTVIYFDLEEDRFEQNPTEIGKFENLEEFFNYLIKQ